MKARLTFTGLLVLILLGNIAVIGQGVSINNDGSDPDPSAMMDIQSTTKGLLIPRMNFGEMNNILSPAEGLIVYCSTFSSFFYYNGTAWEKIGGGEDNDWTLDGNDMYSNNSGLIGIGTTSFPPSHKVNIENSSGTNVLRLIGPGSYGQFGKLNFGDGNYVYFEEFDDDKLSVFGSSELQLSSNYDVSLSSSYSGILLSAPYGGVGINLSDLPTSTLDVNGTIRIRQGNPASHKVLTSTDQGGAATWQPIRSLKYPDGQFPMTPVTHVFSSGAFVVPAGKNLYITNIFSGTGSGYVYIDGLMVHGGFNNYAFYFPTEGPIIAGPGQTVASSYQGCVINGFLINATVQATTTTTTINVPEGQTFVITSVCGSGSQRYLVCNGIPVYYSFGNFNSGSTYNYRGLREPIVVGEGGSVHYNGGVMNGYFINQ